MKGSEHSLQTVIRSRNLEIQISFNVYIYLPKTKKFGCVGRGDLTSHFFSKRCEILEVRGELSINVENKKSSRVDRQACKNYALALVLCVFNNSKSI